MSVHILGWAKLQGSVVKNLPFKQKMQVQSLEKETASHSSIAWETLWTEELGRLSMAQGRREADYLATKQQQ